MPTGGKPPRELLLAEDKKHRLYYAPFEYVNLNARLVIVGITPGPTQMELAYGVVQRSKGQPAASVEHAVKMAGAFGGTAFRTNLLETMD